MDYIFNPAKQISVENDSLLILDERAHSTVSLKRFGTSRTALLRAMKSQGQADRKSLTFLHELVRRGIVVKAWNDNAISERQERSMGILSSKTQDPQLAQVRIAELRPLVLGAGGTGSVVVQHLAAAGVERFVLVDTDQVELSNFNRQLTWETSDVGRMKVDVMHDWVRKRVDNPEIQTFKTRIEEDSDLDALLATSPAIDIIICCIDSPVGIESLMVQAALRRQLPIMTGAVGIEFGHVGPLFTPAHYPCIYCWYKSTRPSQSVPRWSHGVTNSLIGVLMANSVLEWAIDPRRVNLERVTLDFTTFTLHRFDGGICAHLDSC